MSIQLEPLEFIEKIAAFIPYPRRHRRHYHGIFAPSSPLRKRVTEKAQKARIQELQVIQETVEKVEKVSFNWSKLIARIYEVNPLVCSACGKEIKIVGFVTRSDQIFRVLREIGWPTDIPEFDPEYEIISWNICQLVTGSEDGFPDMIPQVYLETVPDPPWKDFIEPDPPHWNQSCDPPFWEE